MPPKPASQRRGRPLYLLIAFALCWFSGLRTAHDGFNTVRVVRNPLAGDSLGLPSEVSEALVEKIGTHASVALPTGLAEILVGTLLVILSALVLFGGRPSLGFTLQVLAANLAVAAVGYLTGSSMRAALIDSLMMLPELQEGLQASGDPELARKTYKSATIVMHVGLLLMATHAATRPRARALLKMQKTEKD